MAQEHIGRDKNREKLGLTPRSTMRPANSVFTSGSGSASDSSSGLL